MFEGAAPRLMLIGDRFTDPRRADRIVQAVRAGVRWVQLRDHQAERETFSERAAQLVGTLREIWPEVWISVNGRPDVAGRLGVGFHEGRGSESYRHAPGVRPEPIGRSVHHLDEAVAAREAGRSYVLYSPIFPTMSKPGHPGRGTGSLADVCRAVPELPVYALGGITPGNVRPCLEAGAYGVAVLSGILVSSDLKGSVAKYQVKLTEQETR